LPAFSAPGLTEAPSIEVFLASQRYPEISYLAVRPSLTSNSTASEQILFSAYDNNSGISLYGSSGSNKVERLAGNLPCSFYGEFADITHDGRLLACLKDGLDASRQSISIIALNQSPAREITRIVLPEAANSVSWSPDGRMLAAATSLNHRAGAVHLYAYNAAQTTFTLKEVLVFPSPVLSRHTGDDPVIDGIAWSPDGRHLALHISGGVMTDYQTLLALSELGPPNTTVDLPVPAGAVTVPAVTVSQLRELATLNQQRFLIWAPTSDALLVSVNEATLARLDVTTGKLTTVLQLPDLPADARGEIRIFAPFPSHDQLVFVYRGSWNADPEERVYVYIPTP
jgi:WD40 repeat protein